MRCAVCAGRVTAGLRHCYGCSPALDSSPKWGRRSCIMRKLSPRLVTCITLACACALLHLPDRSTAICCPPRRPCEFKSASQRRGLVRVRETLQLLSGLRSGDWAVHRVRSDWPARRIQHVFLRFRSASEIHGYQRAGHLAMQSSGDHLPVCRESHILLG